MLAGLGAVRGPGLGPLPAVGRGAGRRRARLRRDGPGDRRARARGAGGVAARVHARRCRSPSWRSCRRARCRAALYDVIRVVSALFPFKPTLDAMDAALNDSGGLAGPLLHLAALCRRPSGRWPARVCAASPERAGPCRPTLTGDGLPRHPHAPPAPDRAAARHGARDRAHALAPRAADVRAARRRTAATPIEAMPGVERLSISHAVEEAGAGARARRARRCCCSACPPRRTSRARAPTTTRAWCSSRCARSRRPTRSWW